MASYPLGFVTPSEPGMVVPELILFSQDGEGEGCPSTFLDTHFRSRGEEVGQEAGDWCSGFLVMNYQFLSLYLLVKSGVFSSVHLNGKQTPRV